MTKEQIAAELARLDQEDAARDTRLNAIKQIAIDNANVAIDQGQIDEYEDNMSDTIGERFSDCTRNEWNIAADLFNKIVGR